MKAQAILFTAPGKVTLAEINIPEPGPGEVLVEAVYTLISPGTELRCLVGKQEGADNWPYIPGYSMSGRVAAVGAGVKLAIGTPVFLTGTTQADVARNWGGHVAHAVCRRDQVWVLDQHVDLLEASIIHMAAIAYRGVRLGAARPHDKVAIVGLGPIGMLSALLHNLTGAHIVAADLSEERVALAQSLGVQAIRPEAGLAESFQAIFLQGADLVVDATGFPAVLKQAITIARERAWENVDQPGARYVVQGSYPADVALPYQEFFKREMSIHFPRDMQPQDADVIHDLLARGIFHPKGIISAVRPPSAAPETYAELLQAKAGLMTVAFQWQ